MKITCESCQSKYTVSDEKVQGKTVKIKCKKCGATILVGAGGATTTNGTPSMVDASPGAAAAPAEGATYLVNVAEGDQRSMSLADVVQAYNTSVVTADTYVWADGMADWQPLGQVDTIVAALHAGTSAPPPAAEAPRAAARRDPNRKSQDLFGSGYGAAPNDVATSAPLFSAGAGAVPAAAPSKPSGAREENSVLFSLSALTAKAGAASAPAPATTATREDSGLIDLKALAASAQPSGGASAAAASPLDLVPDNAGLFPLGMPAVTAPAPTVGAAGPSIAPAPASSSKTGLFIGIGGVVAGLAIVGAFLAMKGGGDKPPATADTTVAAAQATQAPAATAAPTAEPTAAPSAEASAAPSASASAAVAAAAPKAGGHYTGGAKSSAGSTAKSSGAAKSGGASKPAAAAPAKPSKGNCGCAPGDLMCAMKCSTH